MTLRPRLLLPLAVALLAALALPSGASAAGWTCEASALRATILTAPAIEPLTTNAGAGDCKAGAGQIAALPATPLPLTLNLLTAATALDGPAGDVVHQTARSSAGLGAIRIQALASLPIDLPLPDLSRYADILPGVGVIDLRPAIKQVLAQRRLPTADLLSVGGAQARASAACDRGVPRLSGSSTLAAVSVLGQSLPVDDVLTKTVALIDSDAIDPSTLGSLVPGVPLSVLQPLLDALPTIKVPATLARIKLTPGERVGNGVRLTQRALHANVSIAGQRLADVILGEATVGSAGVSCGGVADLALQCTARRIVLIDVEIHHGRVRLDGAADRRYAGKRVRIRSTWNGKTVARPRLSRSGLFHATAKLPPPALRNTNDARYVAGVKGQTSLKLKLVRRMLVSSMRRRGDHVTIIGRVIPPLAHPVMTIEVKRRVSCSSWKVVKRFEPRSDGHFRVRLKAPLEGEAAAYRMHTHVRGFGALHKPLPTFTLPRYVDLASANS